MKCAKCGERIEGTARYCRFCGERLPPAAAASAETIQLLPLKPVKVPGPVAAPSPATRRDDDDLDDLEEQLKAVQSPWRRRLPWLGASVGFAVAFAAIAFVGARSLLQRPSQAPAQPAMAVVMAPAAPEGSPVTRGTATLEAEPSRIRAVGGTHAAAHLGGNVHPDAASSSHRAALAQNSFGPSGNKAGASAGDKHPRAAGATDSSDDHESDDSGDDPAGGTGGDDYAAVRPSLTVYAQTVSAVAHSHDAEAVNCYRASFSDTAAMPSGTVNVNFMIGTDGRPKLINPTGDSLGRPSLGQCLGALVAGWRFPAPPGGDFALTYPFVFAIH